MSAKQAKEKKKETSRSEIFKEIAAKLSGALPELKASLGEKKFDKRAKKAAKLLGEGIKLQGAEKKAGVKGSKAKAAAKKITLPVASKKRGRPVTKK